MCSYMSGSLYVHMRAPWYPKWILKISLNSLFLNDSLPGDRNKSSKFNNFKLLIHNKYSECK